MAQINLLAQVKHNLPNITGSGVDPTSSPGLVLEQLISKLIGILTLVGILYFIFQIIFAGYSMLSSEGDPKKIEMSRDRLTTGILGLFVIMIAIVLGSALAALAGINNPLNVNDLINSLQFN